MGTDRKDSLLKVALLAVAMFTAPAISGVAQPAVTRIGDLLLRYDDAQWVVSPHGDRTEIRCKGEDCEEAIGEFVVGPDKGVGCSLDAHIDDSTWTPGFLSERQNGIDLQILTPDLGCRNLAGGPVFACARHGDKVYLFTGDEHATCRHSSRQRTEALVRLVEGLSAP